MASVLWLAYSFLIALPLACGLSVGLMRWWILPGSPQRETEPPDSALLGTTADRSWPVRMAGQPTDRA